MDRSAIGAALRRERRKLQWTQEQMAEFCSMSDRTIRDIETGVRAVKHSTIAEYAQALGLSLTITLESADETA